MIILQHFGPAWGLPDVSPFCTKVETYLRMANIPFRTQTVDVRRTPKAKLPCVQLEDGTHLCDSRTILAYFESQREQPFDADLTPAQKAVSTAFRGMVEEELYFYVLYLRWQEDDGWSKLVPYLSDYMKKMGVPGLMQPFILRMTRNSAIKALQGQGSGRHSREEVEHRALEACAAVAEQLGDGPYFLGDAPHLIDASVFASLEQLVSAPFPGKVQDFLASKQNVVDYCARMRAQYFASAPDGETQQATSAAAAAQRT